MNELIRLGDALKQVVPNLSGDSLELALNFLVENPEFADLISEELRTLIAPDLEQTYIFPRSVTTKEEHKRQKLQTIRERLQALAAINDLQIARKLGISVQVLPEIQRIMAQAQADAFKENVRHRNEQEALETAHRREEDKLDNEVNRNARDTRITHELRWEDFQLEQRMKNK